MFSKILAIVFLHVFVARCQGNDVWDGLNAKYHPISGEGFHDLPQTLESAYAEGWTKITDDNATPSIIGLGFHDDPRLMVLYSKDGKNSVGVQIGFPTKDVDGTGQPQDYANLNTFVTRTLNDVPYYTLRLYYRIDETSGTRRLWFEEKTGTVEIPTNASQLISDTDFLFKGCVNWMGTHYNKMTLETDCATWYPWFLMTDEDGNVIGIGIQAFGRPSSAETRTWWEPTADYPTIYDVPGQPDCLDVNEAAHGLIVIHVYFVAKPLAIICS